MTEIKGQVIINKDLNRRSVFNYINNLKEISQSLYRVKEVLIEDKEGLNKILKWSIDLDGAPIKWREENNSDEKNYKIEFKLLDGDLDNWMGYWLINKKEDELTITRKINYQFGFGILDQLTGEIIKNKLSTWNQKLLESLSEMIKAEEGNLR